MVRTVTRHLIQLITFSCRGGHERELVCGTSGEVGYTSHLVIRSFRPCLGVDDDANVANFVETETIMRIVVS